MKIGLSTTTVELALAGGISDGISHYTQQLGQGLEQRGIEVESYAFRGPVARSGHELQFSKPINGGFALLGAAGILSGGAARLFAPPVDVFHSTDFKVVPARCPVVATIWDAIPIVHPEWLSAKARFVAPHVLRRVAHFADRVICATEHAAGDIVRHFGVPAANISVVPWGIDASWLEPVASAEVEATLQKHGVVRGYFLAVGTIQPRKNIRRLLEAYKRLPPSIRNDHALVIVGRLGWGASEVMPLLEELVSSSTVKWLQNVASDVEIRHLYHGAHVFVMPSLYEGFGIPLLEAFASGVPVLSSSATSLPEVSAGAALEVDPLDVAAWSEGMAVLAGNSGERDSRRARGRIRAETLSISRAIEMTTDVYQMAISGH